MDNQYIKLGCNYFLILEIRPTNCYNLPGEMSFREIGGVYHPHLTPLGVSALVLPVSVKEQIVDL